jgi:hypothetical protein
VHTPNMDKSCHTAHQHQLVTRSKPVYSITHNTKCTMPFFEVNWAYFISVHKRHFS